MKIVIGIQARSDSTRLPNKCSLQIGRYSILDKVIDVCEEAVDYLRRSIKDRNVEYKVVLLVPEDDPLIAKYKKRMPLVTGSKENVLSRYLKAQKKYDCDYMVRITGDCFFLPNHVVSRHIKSAIYMQQPYTTNTVLRTYPEGYDVEVVSREAMNWLEEHATSDYDREHVTTALKSDFPNNLPFKICYILEKNYDLSAVKTSIDTQEEYYTALKIYDRLEKIKTIAHKTGCVG